MPPRAEHRQDKLPAIGSAGLRSEHRLRGNWSLARALGAVCLQADAGQGRTRTRDIGDAEVAVLLGESVDPVRSRASVQAVRIHANPQCRRPLLLRDMRKDALNRIGSRHIGDDTQPPTAARAEAEIDCKHPA